MRDEEFNRYRPMFPQSKVWKAKTADQPDRPVGPPQPTGQTGHEDRSDRSHQPVRPVEPSAEATTESVQPVSVPSVDEASVVPPIAEDEELVDYKVSPEHRSMWCTYLRITSWFRKRIWLIFSSGLMKLCSRSRARRTITSRLFT